MKITQNYFEQYLKENYIFEKFPRVAIAVSGGPDSICLLFLLNNWIKKNSGSLIALIVDHQLRKESSLEARYISNYLSSKNILSKIIKIQKKNIKKKTMEEARNNRFNCLLNYCKKNNILHLFVGHHFDDNLETFLIRKIAGSNFEGLRSIKNKMISNNLQVLRPLIDINKKDIFTYNKFHKIKFVLDPSNHNLNYTRTIVRNFLLSETSYTDSIIKDFEIIRENYAYYKKMIFHSFHDVLIKINSRSIFIDDKNFSFKDELIQSKIIEIIYKYLKFSKGPLRYKKIRYSLVKLKKPTTSKLNLAGLMIKKENSMIKFIS